MGLLTVFLINLRKPQGTIFEVLSEEKKILRSTMMFICLYFFGEHLKVRLSKVSVITSLTTFR